MMKLNCVLVDLTWFTSPAVVMVRLYADEAVTLWGK